MSRGMTVLYLVVVIGVVSAASIAYNDSLESARSHSCELKGGVYLPNAEVCLQPRKAKNHDVS